MSIMLPAAYSSGPSLADIMPSSLRALVGEANTLGFPRADHVIVILIDGLGAHPLRDRAGHARFLSPRLGKASIISSGFPTTTAAAIASLTTGASPGEHGMIGYRARDSANHRVVNQLNGWDEHLDPATWQRVPTVFEQAQTLGIRSYAIGQPRYQHSGFTQAVLRGAEFIPAQRIGARFAEAGAILENPSLSLTYLYVHELDVAAHAHGWQSDAWLADLEAVDSEVAGLAASLGPRDGLVVTADHGVIDVPASGHVFFDTAPELIDGVELIGGEPRCLQLYLDEDATSADRDRLAEAWRRIEGDRSWIATREEAVRAGWFGSRVDETVLPRIGDVLVAARKQIAYYDSRDPNVAAQAMVGQHGSLSQEETRVPLIRLGVFEL